MNRKRRSHNSMGQTYFLIIKERTPCAGFYDEACYQYYQLRLMNCLKAYQIKLHAYLLQPNEIWLLCTPISLLALSSTVKYLAQAYSEYFNIRFGRRVKVWHGEPVCSLVRGDRMVLDCQKYIESTPLHNGLVSHAGVHRWSSYCTNAFSLKFQYLTAHRSYNDFLQGNDNSLNRYREFVARRFKSSYYLYLQNKLQSGSALIERVSNGP